MESKYEKSVTVLPSLCDSTARLGVDSCLDLFMDAATEHAQQMGAGFYALSARHMFWVTARTMVRFFRRPRLMERVRLATWPEAPERLRCNRDYALACGDEVLAVGKTEWAVIDTQTGRLCEIAWVYPRDLVLTEEVVCPEPFSRIEVDPDAEPFAAHTVSATDIDLGGHMNNVAYARALIDTFSVAEWNALDVSRLELVFRASCHENDVLSFRKSVRDGAICLSASLPDGKAVFLARIEQKG